MPQPGPSAASDAGQRRQIRIASPLRSSFSTKTLRSGDTLIPQGLLAGVLLWLGWQAQRIGWNVWGRGSCCPPGLHCRTAPAPAAPQRPRRSTARAPGHGDAAPGAVQHPSKTGSSSWPHAQVSDAPATCWPPSEPARRCAAACGISIVAAQQFFQQKPTQRRYADPARAACRRAALARLAGPAHWLERLGPG